MWQSKVWRARGEMESKSTADRGHCFLDLRLSCRTEKGWKWWGAAGLSFYFQVCLTSDGTVVTKQYALFVVMRGIRRGTWKMGAVLTEAGKVSELVSHQPWLQYVFLMRY